MALLVRVSRPSLSGGFVDHQINCLFVCLLVRTRTSWVSILMVVVVVEVTWVNSMAVLWLVLILTVQ